MLATIIVAVRGVPVGEPLLPLVAHPHVKGLRTLREILDMHHELHDTMQIFWHSTRLHGNHIDEFCHRALVTVLKLDRQREEYANEMSTDVHPLQSLTSKILKISNLNVMFCPKFPFLQNYQKMLKV